jgi:glycogen synthase
MMRILLVSNLFPPEFIGGYELIAFELATRLAVAGHSVAVVTAPLVNPNQDLVNPPFELHRTLDYAGIRFDPGGDGVDYFRGGFINLANLAALSQAVSVFNPNRILLCNIAGLGPLGVVTFFSNAGFKPLIYMGDNPFDFVGKIPTERDVFYRLFRARRALADLTVVAVAEGVVLETQGALDQQLLDPLYVPGWVPDNLPPLPPGRVGEQLRCVFSSRVAGHKGIWILLDALRLLQERGETGFEVDVYGNGDVPRFIQRAHAVGLGEQVHYVGAVPRELMIQRFADYDALLFPSWSREPLGLVPFEAAAQGCLPVITAGVGAAEWLLTGDCVKIERSAEGLAGGIARLMHMPAAERLTMRVKISQKVRQIYSAARWFPRIEAALAALPEPTPHLGVKQVQEAVFAITRMWKG